ncbi:MAG: hypothetical protein ACYC61_24535 [Isosphaeraceae bacterium]
MSQLGPKREIPCRYCHAPNDPGSSECWLCQRRGWRPLTGLSPAYESPIRVRPRPVTTIGKLMIVIAVIAVFLALAVLAPPVAVALTVSAVPAWIVTEFKDYRRRGGGGYSPGRKFALFLGLTFLFPIFCGATLIAVVVLCVALYR